MSKKNDSKPNGGHEDAAPSSTMLSVRFSEEELAQVKQAAKDRPLAAFIRKSALHASAEAINADHGSNRKTIEAMAKKLADRIKGIGPLLKVGSFAQIEEDEWDVVYRYTDGYGDASPESDSITVRPADKESVAELIAIIENASNSFCEALITALHQEGDDPGFQPAIKKVAE